MLLSMSSSDVKSSRPFYYEIFVEEVAELQKG